MHKEKERDRRTRGNVSDVGRRGVSPSGGIQKASRTSLLLASPPRPPRFSITLSPITNRHQDTRRFVFLHLIITTLRSRVVVIPSFINYRAISPFFIPSASFHSAAIEFARGSIGDSRRYGLSYKLYTGGNIMRRDDFCRFFHSLRVVVFF